MVKFIVVDGIDGSGKSLMSHKIVSYLNDNGYDAVHTFEPTSGHYGQRVRNILTTDDDPKKNAEQCLELFTQDREEHLKQFINPSLDQGKFVVCDRYYYSTIVYQHLQGLSWDKVVSANKDFRRPDVVFIMDLPEVGASGRIVKRGSAKEKFEDSDFLGKLRDGFLGLKKKLDDNIIVVDASKSKKEVFSSITKELDKLLAEDSKN
jgi:dTMP kinase